MFDVYAIKDLEKGKFAVPFFVPEGTEVKDVIIDFKRDLQKGVMQLFLDPSNYELWKVANYDPENGDFEECSDLIIAGSDLTGMKSRDDVKIAVDIENGKAN